MKSQSFKKFAIALVLGLVSIFGAASVSAQTRSSFETSFEFHVGKDKYAAGRYELQKLDYGKYLLRSVETKKSRVVYFDLTESNDESMPGQRVSFNRYGDTYFLRGLFEGVKADGKAIIESNYEKQIRKAGEARENQLAGDKAKPEKVSVNLTK